MRAATCNLGPASVALLGELRLGREHTIDAILMASTARRGDTVYTSAFDDMARLATKFPGVRVLAV